MKKPITFQKCVVCCFIGACIGWVLGSEKTEPTIKEIKKKCHRKGHDKYAEFELRYNPETDSMEAVEIIKE